MSIFGDYKSYKKYEPIYPEWKKNRDIAEAKRLAYLEKHPEAINQDDIQRGKILMRAIDIMDEHSQKKAENMEAATEPVIELSLELAGLGGAAAGAFLGSIKPIGKFFARIVPKHSKNKIFIGIGVPAALGFLAGSFASFPLMAWGAKAEVSASRKGRFDAMRTELSNPSGFAVLNEKQIAEANEIAKNITLDEDKKKKVSEKISNGLNFLKEMASDSKEYKEQKKNFELELEKDKQNFNEKISEKEIENAEKDKQLLTKLIEKIDIASQDYAENSELATQAGIITVGALGSLAYIYAEKIFNALKIKSAKTFSAVTKGLSIAAFAIMGIIAARINKEASRVGRYKIKQELLNNPNNFVYVSEEQANEIKDVDLPQNKQPNMFAFLIKAIKNKREYDKYKKTLGKEERRFYKATEKIELSPEQTEAAKKLQKNTFKTFNKIDENSQKYAESIEALGQSAAYPINTAFGLGAGILATPYLLQAMNSKTNSTSNFLKYFGIVTLSTIPAMLINTYITKEQKKASKIADMKAINELNDYRHFK